MQSTRNSDCPPAAQAQRERGRKEVPATTVEIVDKEFMGGMRADVGDLKDTTRFLADEIGKLRGTTAQTDGASQQLRADLGRVEQAMKEDQRRFLESEEKTNRLIQQSGDEVNKKLASLRSQLDRQTQEMQDMVRRTENTEQAVGNLGKATIDCFQQFISNAARILTQFTNGQQAGSSAARLNQQFERARAAPAEEMEDRTASSESEEDNLPDALQAAFRDQHLLGKRRPQAALGHCAQEDNGRRPHSIFADCNCNLLNPSVAFGAEEEPAILIVRVEKMSEKEGLLLAAKIKKAIRENPGCTTNLKLFVKVCQRAVVTERAFWFVSVGYQLHSGKTHQQKYCELQVGELKIALLKRSSE